MARHAKVRQEEKLTAAVLPLWSSTHKLSGVTSARATDAIDLCFQITSQKAGYLTGATGELSHCGEDADCFKTLYQDVSQDGARRPWANKVRSMVRNSDIYAWKQDRTLTGSEHLRCLGFETKKLDLSHHTDRELKDLAGEAMAVPSISLVSVAALLASSVKMGIFTKPL